MSNDRLVRNASPVRDSITVKESQDVVALWKEYFPRVTVITSPEQGQPYLTLAHGFTDVDHMDVNGLQMKSPLFTMALASFEVAKNTSAHGHHYAHAYEVMWPNVSNPSRERSNMGNYVNNLWRLGMEVHADHYHWKTDSLNPAIHHMGTSMSPLDFSSRTITALLALLNDTESNAYSSDVPTTANTRGSISLPNANGIVNANGNGNGMGMNVGAKRVRKHTT